MCGRLALTHTREEIERLFGVVGVEPFPPRYNVAPTQPLLVITAGQPRTQGSNLPDREAVLMRWGLLPAWVKDPGDFPLLINARSETAAAKASFRAAVRHRRCIIPASGFYEWSRDKPSGRSQAFWVRPRDGRPVGFAGLHETWIGNDGSEIDTCAIMTMAAPADLSHIHHRVPVALLPGHHDRWLDVRGQNPADIVDLFRPDAQVAFDAIAVSDKVNKVANAAPDVQEPVEPHAFVLPGAAKTVANPSSGGEEIQPSLF